jgi:hypothetical protein
MTYTPGPWKACYSDKFGGGNIRSDHHRDGTGALLLEAGPMFHDYTPDRDEELANLRLAAASPDLLEALKALLNEESEKGGEAGDWEWTRFSEADPTGNWHAAKLAIDKATATKEVN